MNLGVTDKMGSVFLTVFNALCMYTGQQSDFLKSQSCFSRATTVSWELPPAVEILNLGYTSQSAPHFF